jgi:hypothetical protein
VYSQKGATTGTYHTFVEDPSSADIQKFVHEAAVKYSHFADPSAEL